LLNDDVKITLLACFALKMGVLYSCMSWIWQWTPPVRSRVLRCWLNQGSRAYHYGL